MNSCPYCAQTDTRKDEMGYCKKYWCFQRSGKYDILQKLLDRAHKIYFLPKSKHLEIRSYVTNTYSPRDREANNILWDAKRAFDGIIPFELIKAIPSEHQKKWDRNIRW